MSNGTPYEKYIVVYWGVGVHVGEGNSRSPFRYHIPELHPTLVGVLAVAVLDQQTLILQITPFDQDHIISTILSSCASFRSQQ